MYKVVKLNNNVLVYDIDSPDSKMEFMDNIDAKPGDVFRFTYNGWLEYIGNDYDDIIESSKEVDQAKELLAKVQGGAS
jgi:hypothetical protein